MSEEITQSKSYLSWCLWFCIYSFHLFPKRNAYCYGFFDISSSCREFQEFSKDGKSSNLEKKSHLRRVTEHFVELTSWACQKRRLYLLTADSLSFLTFFFMILLETKNLKNRLLEIFAKPHYCKQFRGISFLYPFINWFNNRINTIWHH